jgi:excisionase family DNA binding protein
MTRTSLERLSVNLETYLKQNEKPLNLKDAAKYLNISISYLYQLTSSKQITFYKPHRKKIYFQKSDLNAWLFKNKSESIIVP